MTLAYALIAAGMVIVLVGMIGLVATKIRDRQW
jgi:hypothetical protein